MTIKETLSAETKAAMRARDKARLGVLRLIASEVKRIEVDERIDVDDTRLLAILDKMSKQRSESESQYRQAERTDLADQEAFEIAIIREFMPEPLDAAALDELVREAISNSGAESMKDMGKVMGILKPQIQGRADMGAVSAQVKALLAG